MYLFDVVRLKSKHGRITKVYLCMDHTFDGRKIGRSQMPLCAPE